MVGGHAGTGLDYMLMKVYNFHVPLLPSLAWHAALMPGYSNKKFR